MLLMISLNFGDSERKVRHTPAFVAQCVEILFVVFSSVRLVEFQKS